VTGTLTDGRTVALDEGLPLGPTRVRVTIERLPARAARPYRKVVARIRAGQARRGHRPPTRVEAAGMAAVPEPQA
jgi:hypothetical protein